MTLEREYQQLNERYANALESLQHAEGPVPAYIFSNTVETTGKLIRFANLAACYREMQWPGRR